MTAPGGRPLSELTLEELWELFPIALSPPRSCWADWYGEEREGLAALLRGTDLSLHHIGSTAIRGIWAKPIVDLLLEIPGGVPMAEVRETLVRGGWLCMSEAEERMSFNKGYTPRGFAERVFHLHLRRRGDRDEVYFRDYLNAHPGAAKEYERLKLSLWKRYEHDRDAYTAAKGGFVRRYTRAAKEEFQISEEGTL